MPSQSETIIRGLLASADIEVNGSNPWDIQIHDDRFYRRVLSEIELGLGESYMDGWWDCQAIDQFVDRALRARLERKIQGNWKKESTWLPPLETLTSIPPLQGQAVQFPAIGDPLLCRQSQCRYT